MVKTQASWSGCGFQRQEFGQDDPEDGSPGEGEGGLEDSEAGDGERRAAAEASR